MEKSNVLIFNMKDQPEHLVNIKVVQKVKYLGIEIVIVIKETTSKHRYKIIQKVYKSPTT